MPRKRRGQDNLNRVDLTVESREEIEELKDTLTSSLESETDAIAARSVLSLEALAARGAVGLGVRFWELQGLELTHSRSVPSSPRRVKNPLEFEKFLPRRYVSCNQLYNLETNMALKDELKPLTGSRAGYKQWVTKTLNNLKSAKGTGELDLYIFQESKSDLLGYISEIKGVETKIREVYDKFNIPLEDTDRKADMEATASFLWDAKKKLAGFEKDLVAAPTSPLDASGGHVSGSNAELIDALKKIGGNNTKVNLDCITFKGDDKDKFQFKHWFSQFESVIKANPSWSEVNKMNYLKTKVVGNAAPFIQHLDPDPGNYAIAIEVLKKEYLDIPYLTDQLCAQLISSQPSFSEDYSKTRNYIADIRNKLFDLKTHYNVDLLDPNTGGYVLASHIVFSKLSRELQRALIIETKTGYPTFDQILINYGNVINNLVETRPKKPPAKHESKGGKPPKSSLEPTALRP